MEKDEESVLLTKMNGIADGIAELGKEVVATREGLVTLDTRVKAIEGRVFDKAYTLPGSNEGKNKGKFSFAKAMFAIVTNQWEHAQFELDVFKETRKRAMDTGSGSAGYLVPAEQMLDLIELIYANTVVIKMGASVLSGLTGSPVTWPRQLTGAVAYWVGENAAITESGATFGQLNLTPKKVAALVKMSNDLTILSNPSAEAIVRNDIAVALGLGIDLAALRGSGSANQPRGIANQADILTAETHVTNGVAFNWDHANAMEGALDDANTLRGKLGFVFPPKVKRLLKRQKVAQYSGDTGGQYIVLPTISDQMLRDLLGYDFGTTTQVPVNLTKGSAVGVCAEVYFANWAELLIGMWGGLEILASNVAGDNTGGAFSSDQLWIRAIQRVDLGLRHPASFCLLSDANITGA